MKKSNIVTTTELIEFTHEQHNISWNKAIEKLDFDGAAFQECGSFDYTLKEVTDELLRDEPDNFQYQIIKEFMEKKKVKSITVIRD